jgi:hypothetical protein
VLARGLPEVADIAADLIGVTEPPRDDQTDRGGA